MDNTGQMLNGGHVEATGVSETDEKEILAKGDSFYKQLQEYAFFLKKFMEGYKALHFNVVVLINERTHLRAEIAKAEIEKSKIEELARTRLDNIDRGHHSIIDKLSKRELELATKLKDIEQREAILTAKNREVELLRAEYQKRVDGVASLKASVESI